MARPVAWAALALAGVPILIFGLSDGVGSQTPGSTTSIATKNASTDSSSDLARVAAEASKDLQGLVDGAPTSSARIQDGTRDYDRFQYAHQDRETIVMLYRRFAADEMIAAGLQDVPSRTGRAWVGAEDSDLVSVYVEFRSGRGAYLAQQRIPGSKAALPSAIDLVALADQLETATGRA